MLLDLNPHSTTLKASEFLEIKRSRHFDDQNDGIVCSYRFLKIATALFLIAMFTVTKQ